MREPFPPRRTEKEKVKIQRGKGGLADVGHEGKGGSADVGSSRDEEQGRSPAAICRGGARADPHLRGVSSG
jgi:hypothetical protein